MTPDIIEQAWPHSGGIEAVFFIDAEGKETFYALGSGIDRIEKTVKCGDNAYIPYVRVWSGDVVIAELCQHRLNRVTFLAV